MEISFCRNVAGIIDPPQGIRAFSWAIPAVSPISIRNGDTD
jgi:hypothetical protein